LRQKNRRFINKEIPNILALIEGNPKVYAYYNTVFYRKPINNKHKSTPNPTKINAICKIQNIISCTSDKKKVTEW
jgi:hypothetical protein